jgi:hypothetical protein
VLFEFAVSFAQTRVEYEHLIPVWHHIDCNDDLVSGERLGGRSGEVPKHQPMNVVG